MPKLQIKIRDNFLEPESTWSHHYLQQKRLAVLVSTFQNTTAPSLTITVPLFPALTQVCLPALCAFAVAESLQKSQFLFFFP